MITWGVVSFELHGLCSEGWPRVDLQCRIIVSQYDGSVLHCCVVLWIGRGGGRDISVGGVKLVLFLLIHM